MLEIFQFAISLILLIFGADFLVKGASNLARSLGVSSLIVGLTVVAFGTSAPELAVSLKAGLSGQSAIALGNVVGSNIFNILFILGASAMVAPLIVSNQLIKLDVPIMIGVAVLAYLFSLDGLVSKVEGFFLFAILIIYIFTLLKISKNQQASNDDEPIDKNYLKNFTLIIVGLGMLVLGSDWLITTVVMFAKYLGVSELIISLTIVSAGTSLPEVVTSIVASFKGERDIAVGNVVGSNIFNILSVLGLTALFTPDGIPVNSSMIAFDLPVMIAVSLACMLIFMIGRGVTRLEGALLFLYYIIYTGFLILIATKNTINVMFVELLIYFVAIITVVSLLVIFNIKRETSNS